MSDEQRMELWALVRKGLIRTYYRSLDLAIEQRKSDEDLMHLIEIREGERIVSEEAFAVIEAAKAQAKFAETEFFNQDAWLAATDVTEDCVRALLAAEKGGAE